MQAVMENPAAIDTSLIQPAEIQNLARSFLSAVKSFYEDPANEAEFREWKRRRTEETMKHEP